MNELTEQKGVLAMLLYVLFTAASSLLIQKMNLTITPLLSAFYTFLVCLLVYQCLAKRVFKKGEKLKAHINTIVILNITTAICWILTFLALKFIAPELYLYIYLCAMPISAALINRVKLGRMLLYCVGLLMLIFTYQAKHLILGSILAFIGGSAGTIYSLFSKKLSEDFTILEILSLRFYLTVFITLLICSLTHSLVLLSPMVYISFIGLSFVSVIVPLTLFQVGIQYLPISKALFFLPLAPLLCYFLHVYFSQQSLHPWQLAIVTTLSLLMLSK